MCMYYTVMCLKDRDGMANSVNPDQTALMQAHLGLHCLPVQKLRIIMVASVFRNLAIVTYCFFIFLLVFIFTDINKVAI